MMEMGSGIVIPTTVTDVTVVGIRVPFSVNGKADCHASLRTGSQ